MHRQKEKLGWITNFEIEIMLKVTLELLTANFIKSLKPMIKWE
jgi:hypothetical protein